MGHRRALKGVACALVESFVSRNNDVSGYWGIGKLYREAIEHSASSVSIDLLSNSTPPLWPVAQNIQAHYAPRLEHMASMAAVPLSEAQVVVEFGTFGSCAPPKRRSHGDPFVCTVSLVDSKGRTYKAARAGCCSPHDPARESCSNRVGAP